MPKKALPILYSNLPYEMGQDFLDIQYCPSVGLCVDFCAHIVHGFLTGHGNRYITQYNGHHVSEKVRIREYKPDPDPKSKSFSKILPFQLF